MTGSRTTVVPFERPAAYWATRARRHYTPARLPDAAKLMRKALEKSGDADMALELAQIYADMECHTAAERCLLKAVARGGLTGGACFALACCALSRDEDALAERALEISLRLDPEGVFSEQAQDILEMHAWPEGEYLPRGARGETLCQRAREALLAGKRERALEWARLSWKKSRSCQAAMLLGALLPPGDAIFYLDFAARRSPGAQRPRLFLAQACFRAGKPAQALGQLTLAGHLCDNIAKAEAFCAVAWECGRPEEALKLAAAQLEKTPASVDYLRLKYLSLKRMNDEEGAARALETLLDTDPDDAAGLWYRRHPEDTRPYAGRLMLLTALACQLSAVPRRLTPGPLNRLLHFLVMGLYDALDTETIYRLTPPLWRRLSPAEKAACDARKNAHFPLAISLYLLLSVGKMEKARELYAAAPGKKRVIRALRRFAQLMNEE